MHNALLMHVMHAFQNLQDELGRFLLIQCVLLGNVMKQFTSTNSRGRERNTIAMVMVGTRLSPLNVQFQHQNDFVFVLKHIVKGDYVRMRS